jgi:GNAT superfamily N-acetyltransferase
VPEAPLAENAGIAVVRLSPALAGDFVALFDRAFPDNPDWSGCYCRYYHSAEEPWDSTPATAARHRAEAAEAIGAGLQTGFLAYVDGPGSTGAAVGWLNAGARTAFTNRRGYEGAADAWAMCFVVDPAWRGRGIAGALLEGALAAFRTDGLRSVEAWPRASRPDDPASFAAGSYKGPRSLYERLGFQVAGEGPHGSLHMRAEL